jgi:hypothetical protein
MTSKNGSEDRELEVSEMAGEPVRHPSHLYMKQESKNVFIFQRLILYALYFLPTILTSPSLYTLYLLAYIF